MLRVISNVFNRVEPSIDASRYCLDFAMLEDGTMIILNLNSYDEKSQKRRELRGPTEIQVVESEDDQEPLSVEFENLLRLAKGEKPLIIPRDTPKKRTVLNKDNIFPKVKRKKRSGFNMMHLLLCALFIGIVLLLII